VVGAANLTAYDASNNPILLIVSALLGIPAGIVLLMQKRSPSAKQNSEV
jgi:F0F1-type ATP synthase assembly protein I